VCVCVCVDRSVKGFQIEGGRLGELPSLACFFCLCGASPSSDVSLPRDSGVIVGTGEYLLQVEVLVRGKTTKI
jgi:hypothetical protein